jgi:ABC-type branched-subunit amino acid transport system ATPase component
LSDSAERSLLEVHDAVVKIGAITAVDGASLAIPEGVLASLIGPNGAGKTSLFNALTGFYRLDHGSVHFDGHRIDRLAPHRIAGAGLVRTFQHGKVFRRLSVMDNMRLGAADHPGEGLISTLTRPGRARGREREVTEQARELLDGVGLLDRADQLAGNLSGGQRKLLELARALMCGARLVLLDEPMAGVNPTTGRRLMERVDALRVQRGLTVLFVEHQLDVVMNMSDLVVVMAAGKVIASGTPAEVRASDEVRAAYLGRWEPTTDPADQGRLAPPPAAGTSGPQSQSDPVPQGTT